MQRIEADLREHYWYDELVNEGFRQLEAYLAFWAAVAAGRDHLGEPAS